MDQFAQLPLRFRLFTGRTAVVAGAGRGIGLATVRTLIDEGVRVVGAAPTITPEPKETGAITVTANLSTADGVTSLIDSALAELGGIDLLVNNVGGGDEAVMGFLDAGDAQWTRMFDVNVLATVRATRAALPSLIERRGAVVNISSASARMPSGVPAGYSAVKPDVPIYTGAREAEASLFLNLFAQGTDNHLLEGRPALEELQFTGDPDGRLEGVDDVFGDGSFFAVLTPGHTTGHVPYLARITAGPVLMTGDVCHTRWGWDNDVEPGTFLAERDASRDSLLAMKALSKRHPNMAVKLGHQP
ncbi:SDR family NAD(P)-dependent oxidoreductase [Streptomyces niveiscabiei]|uniref:SDR family NAD(P)-dependent oxidoreductase n=1 Tax=Streptomyces niveiscabiei TaxID=164115 RepID=UPI0029B334BC|nr:SDR family NAD(P)-dependent oxidoreductase [Streptomyces niveiscabiei]MDX3388242.1 SDR family NAD(P)-dependent oxidoreductase [Streptomyces niveiscabiei]